MPLLQPTTIAPVTPNPASTRERIVERRNCFFDRWAWSSAGNWSLHPATSNVSLSGACGNSIRDAVRKKYRLCWPSGWMQVYLARFCMYSGNYPEDQHLEESKETSALDIPHKCYRPKPGADSLPRAGRRVPLVERGYSRHTRTALFPRRKKFEIRCPTFQVPKSVHFLTTFTTKSTTTSPRFTTTKHTKNSKPPNKNHVSTLKTFSQTKTRKLVETCTQT